MQHPSPSPCRIHTDRASHWICESCRLPLCTDCKPYAEQLPDEVRCPLCSHAMQETAREAREMPRTVALRNALAPPGLALAAGMAAITALGLLSLAGLVLALPVGLALFYLMLTLLRRAGEGRTRPPRTSELIDIESLEQAWKLLPVGLPYAGILLLAAASGSPALLVTAWLLTALLLPASLIAALCRDSSGAGFAPALLQRVISVTRSGYFPLAAFAAAAVAIGACGMIFAGDSVLIRAPLGFAAALLALGLSSCSGMLAREHKRRLEYDAGVAAIDRPRRPRPEVVEPAQLAADAELLLHEQRVHEARQLLGRALTRYPDDRVLSERFDRLVSETATPAEIRSHLERRMQRLIRSGQPAVAAELWQRNRPKLGNWVPRVSQTRYRLALALDDLGEHQTAFRLLIGLPPDDERFSKIAEAWMEAARILEDDLQDSARARELRALVLRRYPERARRWLARRGETGPAEDRPASRRAASAAG